MINNFTNNSQAAVFAERNLTIRKDSTNAKTAKIDNISAEITAYFGNINLYASVLNNKRSENKIQNAEVRWSTGCNFHHHECHYNSYATKTFSGNEGLAANINVGNDLTINSDNFTNDASNILVGNDIAINTNTFNNNTQKFESYNKAVYDWWQCGQDCNLNGAPFLNYYSENYSGVIKAGKNITVNSVNNISNEFTTPHVSPNGILGKTPQFVNAVSIDLAVNLGTINIDLTSYLNGPANQGLFTKNPNPNGPLFETRSQFIDQSQFFGSDYFYTQIGFNINDVNAQLDQQNKRMIGDQFFQNKIISEQLNTLTKNSFLLSQSNIDSNLEIKSLLDNASSEYARLGLTPNQALTQTQINNLQKDIVWYQTEIINGQTFIAPVIYLSQATRDSLKNNISTGSTIFAGNNINLNSSAGSITNSGSIFGNNLLLSANKNIINQNSLSALNGINLTAGKDILISAPSSNSNSFSALSLKDDAQNARASSSFNAGTDIQINSGGNLNIANSYFQSGGSIYMAAAGDINNSNYTIKAGNDVVMSATNINNIHTTTNSNETRIEGGRMVSLDATNDINNIGATIKAGTLLYMTAGNDINNKALIDYKINGVSATEADALSSNAKNIRSTLISQGNLISNGDLVLVAGNNINNKASNITATGSGYLEATNGNINITTAALRDRTFTEGGSKRKHWTSLTDTTENLQSNLTFGNNLTLTSAFDTNIIGSNITASGNGEITSQFGNVNVLNAIDSKMTQTTASKKGTFSSRSDSVYDYKETAAESKLNFGTLALSAEFGTFNQRGSTLSTVGDLKIGDFTVAQNLDGTFRTNANGTYETVSGQSVAGVNITSATLRSEHSESHQKSSLNLGTVALMVGVGFYTGFVGLYAANELGAFNSIYKQNQSQTRNTNTTEYSSNINAGGNFMMNSADNVNISASNLNITGSAFLNNTGNFNISSKAETTSSSVDNSQIELGKLNSTFDLSHASATFGMQGSGTSFEADSKTSTQKSSNINIGGSLLSNVQNDMTLTASNLDVTGDSIIKTGGSFSLNNGFDTTSYSSKESKLTVEAGVRVGNAYVDAAYAWKAVADATSNLKKAEQKLEKIKNLHDEDKASSKAVELAALQVTLAATAIVQQNLVSPPNIFSFLLPKPLAKQLVNLS